MSSPKFERVKSSNPRLAVFLDQIVGDILSQVQKGQPYIIPKLAAAALHLKEAEAFVLLEVLANGDVLQRIFNVYCRNNDTLLTTVDSVDALDDIPRCDDCDEVHRPEELRVQIAFEIKNGDLLGVA